MHRNARLVLAILSLVLLPARQGFASADWFGDLKTVTYSFIDQAKRPAEVALTFQMANHFNPEPRPEKVVTAIQVAYRGKTIVIPKEEIDGIPKIQLDTISFRTGTYQDGSDYCYIYALFGPPMKECREGYQIVWFSMQEDYKERVTFASLPQFFKQTSVKEKGRPVEKLE